MVDVQPLQPSDLLTEEQRAEEYRRKMQAREDNKALAEEALKASPEAHQQAHIDYEPLLRVPGWDPVRKTVRDIDQDDD